MGYSTDLFGQFSLNKRLKPEHLAYLQAFSETRRMKRDAVIANTMPDPVREAAGLPVGADGAYFVAGAGYAGQDRDKSVIDSNTPPGQPNFGSGTSWEALQTQIKTGTCQPGLWCQWVPNDDGTAIQWNGAEKFYHYVEWIKYLIANFLGPWGYVLNGEVSWQGEDSSDIGKILIENNVVKVGTGQIVYDEPKTV